MQRTKHRNNDTRWDKKARPFMNKEAIEFYKKLRSSPIDDNNRPGFRLIQKELNTKLNK